MRHVWCWHRSWVICTFKQQRHDQGVPKMTCAVRCNDARTIRQCLPYWREGVYLTFLSLLFAKQRRHLKILVNRIMMTMVTRTNCYPKNLICVTNPQYIGTWSTLTFVLGFLTRIAWVTLSCKSNLTGDYQDSLWWPSSMRIHVVVTSLGGFISGTPVLVALVHPTIAMSTPLILLIVCHHSQFSTLYTDSTVYMTHCAVRRICGVQ